MRQRTAAYSLSELLIASLISITLGCVIVKAVQYGAQANATVFDGNGAQTATRRVIDTFADQLRGATAVTAASASDITFTDPVNGTVRYWLSNGAIRKTVNSAPTGGTVFASNITSMQLYYYQYNGSAWAAPTQTPATPANIAAVAFVVNSTLFSSSRQITGTVQIRAKRP